MARVKNPLLFSRHFAISESVFVEDGLVDPFLNVDTQLFIDPVLLSKSSHDEISGQAYQAFREHFSNYVRLLAISEKEDDAAWKAARRLLSLREPPQTGLGYGGSGRSGSSRPDDIQTAIMKTSREIISIGAKDPEMISLMGFFEENVGPDTISDFTTRVIIKSLAKLTESFCKENGVPVETVDEYFEAALPKYIEKPIILVPRDIVRDLPIARDWSDIEAAALQSRKIRERVNAFLAGLARPTVANRKAALRHVALGSPENFEEFLKAVKENASAYDSTRDALGYYKIRDILSSSLDDFKQDETPDIKENSEALFEFVLGTIAQFQHHVEKGNLWEELWDGAKPKKERAAQLIYFAIADCFCRANDVDISPEANMGGGPIDFKFSQGYRARVLVEIKRSGGTVKHGYEKQLEIYKDASRTNFGILVVMDFGDRTLPAKLAAIQKIRADRIAVGEPASEIIVIDARKKASASKRK